MRTTANTPDALPPGFRRLSYGLFCWFIRSPVVLRGIGALLRLWPFAGGLVGLVARAHSVTGVLTRPKSFSSTAHAPDLVAGNYLIAMDPGPTYDADRALLGARLEFLKDVQAIADGEAQRLIAELKQSRERPVFDLIDDYLTWIAFRSISPVFGAAADKLAVGEGGDIHDRGLLRQYFMEIRYVAGQLLDGSSSPIEIRGRAELCGDALRARVRAATDDLRRSWNAYLPSEVIERNALGLTWVSHPVTVQSAALVLQELLSRPSVYRALRSRAAIIGASQVWQDDEFRKHVREHVLELMRFRPIFPLLARDVPRDTELETGARRNAQRRGGAKVTMWAIGALFDPSAVANSRQFCPHRDWGNHESLRYLVFGYGDRQCPAKEYALDILTSALIGLLILPEVRLAYDDGKAIEYDGPLMSRMRVRFAKRA
jgi:cytochrome P450